MRFAAFVLAFVCACAPTHRLVARPLGAKSSCPTVGEVVLDSFGVVGLLGASVLVASADKTFRAGVTAGAGVTLAVGDVIAEVTCK